MMVVYVSTPKHPWSEQQIKATFNEIWNAVRAMEKESDRYDAYLDVSTWKYYTVSVPMECTENNVTEWYWYLMHNFFKVQNMTQYHERLTKKENADSTPMVFMFNSVGANPRFAGWTFTKTADKNTWDEEFSYIFCRTGNGFFGGWIMHELMHQYGAVDFYDYKNEGVQAAAQRYLGQSVMINNAYVVDDLTAYLLGWTDGISRNDRRFLQETQNRR